ncbi:hypothetical protein P775_23055 [Puniceibacterium antarcticum]|uniref:Uncharacterized protein n=1 Tax=Puniceibacterium antarcticum TaxID=1206336 RepID=A0A2G8R8B5_9RHOB|nr:hypothetical protein P775_23055 [Puniceibacterium antarcticum]
MWPKPVALVGFVLQVAKIGFINADGPRNIKNILPQTRFIA